MMKYDIEEEIEEHTQLVINFFKLYNKQKLSSLNSDIILFF